MQQSSSSFPAAAAWWCLPPPPTSCEHRELINTKKTEVIDTRRPIKRLAWPIIRLQVASGSASLNKERLGRPGARTGGERGVQGAAGGQRQNRLKKPCTEGRTAAEERTGGKSERGRRAEQVRPRCSCESLTAWQETITKVSRGEQTHGTLPLHLPSLLG